MASAARRTARLLGALVALGPMAPRAVLAQPVTGGFDDASIARRGELRIRFGAVFDATTDQFGAAGRSGSRRTPLGTSFTFDTLGAAQIPAIAATQRVLRDSIGVTPTLFLGNVQTGVRQLVTRIPLRLELGITSRIALDVRAPIVRTRSAARVSVNPGGGTGNLGFNPADTRFSQTAASAASRNGLVQTELNAAVGALQQRLDACPTTSMDASCAAIVANRAAAVQLVTDAGVTRRGIAAVYGTATTGSGSPFVPIAGSDAERAVEARLDDLRTRFARFGVTNLGETTRPAAATARIANAGLRTILSDPTLGFSADTVFSVERGGTGDIEAGARFKWLDTFAETGAPTDGVHARSTAELSYQIGTLGTDLPTLLFDVPLGTAASGVVVRSETDVGLGRRFTATIAGRYVRAFGDEQTVRVPYVVGSLLAPASREQTVSRRPGSELHLELTPRWSPNAAFALSGNYAFTSKQADRFTGSFSVPSTPYIGTDVFDASALGIGTGGRAQRLGFGATYSTLAGFSQRRTGIPAEVSYVHTQVFAGSGGGVPRVTTDGLLVRVYMQLFGAGRRGR